MLISFCPAPGLPFRAKWLATISEFEWNDHFCDEQLKGPFAKWKHCHRIASETRDDISGTSILDELEYEVPLGPLGLIANAIFVRRQMEATFRYRQQELVRILPVAAQQASGR